MESTAARKTPLVTFESVAAAAESLATTGQKPSVRAVIGVLGGGSPNAVLPHLNAWRAARPTVKAADVTIDPRFAALLSEQIAQATAEAVRELEAKLAVAESDLEASIETGNQFETRTAELTVELERGQSENQQLTGRVAALAAELEQLKQDTARTIDAAKAEAEKAIEQARADASREREAAEQARQALARAELRLEGIKPLETQLAQLRTQLDTEHAARMEAEKAAAVAVAERNAGTRQLESAEAAHQEQRKRTADETHRLVERMTRAETERDEARKEAKVSGIEAAKLRGQLDALSADAKPSRSR